MYGCESWTIKKAEHQRIDVFELWCWRRLLKSLLDCKEIQPVHPRGDQSWVFTERTDVKAETPILWPPDAKSWLIWKDPDAGKDWGWEEKGMTEDEMVGWHHLLNGHEFGYFGKSNPHSSGWLNFTSLPRGFVVLHVSILLNLQARVAMSTHPVHLTLAQLRSEGSSIYIPDSQI